MSKQSVIEHVAQAAADFGAAADAVDEAAALAFGVNRTDLRIIGVLGPGGLSAGTVAAAAGLSPAAATTAIQRLVARGHLTRATDSGDRRRAVVTLTPAARRLLEDVYEPVGRGGMVELRRYTTAELEIIGDFLDRGRRFQLSEAQRIRGMAAQALP